MFKLMNVINTASRLLNKRLLSTTQINRRIESENNIFPILYDWKQINNSQDPNQPFSYYIPALPADTIRAFLQIKTPSVKTEYFILKMIPWPNGVIIKDKKYGYDLKRYRLSFLAFKEFAGKLKVKRSQICRKARAASIITFPSYATIGCDYLMILNEKTHKAEWSLFLNSIEDALIILSKKYKEYKQADSNEPIKFSSKIRRNFEYQLD